MRTFCQAAYGTVEDFRRGLEVVGIPHPRAREQMQKEHKDKADSRDIFVAWNSGPNRTFPAKEFHYVVDPFEHESINEGTSPSKWVPRHEYGGGRFPIRLQVFLHAMAARCDDLAFGDYKEADKLEKTDGRWLHSEEVSKGGHANLLRLMVSKCAEPRWCRFA